jgi:cytochrome c oxidase subunit 5b
MGDERHPVEVKAVGAADGEIPDEIEQTAGRAYEEYVMAEKGLRAFNRGPLTGPFGTQEKPTLVLSTYEERIVGCVGGNGNDHDVNWFGLKKNQKTMCVLCGQFFMLEPDQLAELESETPGVAGFDS